MYRVGIEVGAKWAMILLLVVLVAIFVMGRYTKSTFLSVMAVGNMQIVSGGCKTEQGLYGYCISGEMLCYASLTL